MADQPTSGVAGSPRRTSRVAMLGVPAEFARCLARPPLLRSGAFALHVARSAPTAATDGINDGINDGDAPGDPVWRLGLVIPKRYEASAVARNTIKRRWRAAFRQGQDGWSAEFGSADVVVRMQGPLLAKGTAGDVVEAMKPAKRRARALFEPQAMLTSLAERLRRGPDRRDDARRTTKRGQPQATVP